MMSIKWGLSVLDWRDHAINDHHGPPDRRVQSPVRAFADDGHPTAGHIVRDSMPGVRDRNHRYGFATVRDSDRPPG
jgi:hypothetical protein